MAVPITASVKKLETRDLELAVLSMIVTFICAFSLVAIYLSFTLQPLEKNLVDPGRPGGAARLGGGPGRLRIQ